MNRYLLLDTASEPARLGLSDGPKVAKAAAITPRQELSRRLLGSIDALLKGAKCERGDLTAIGVVTGPGPFTGLRIGLAVANALAAGLEIPIVAAERTAAPDLKALAAHTDREFAAGRTQAVALPNYGRPPSITLPKKN